MPALSWLAAPFKFAPASVSILTIFIYSLVFGLVLRSDELSDVPKKTKGLSLERAYADLHQITARPHPYLSHANDDVHAYLLSQLSPIASRHDYVHLSDDLTANASFVVSGHGVYFEGANILVKIDGTDPSSSLPDGVLFSAHYDSVSTAPGATDDGMGVVTLVELVRYFASPEHRPRRTAIFFINNGEEDGLNGAYAYWRHPWSNLTANFINLEGAASGGRPILFRSTSLGPTRSLLSNAISHLQADVLTGDAYKRGVVRSYTDYQVYAAGLKGKLIFLSIAGQVAPMGGLDVAFYKNRAFYHTPRDSIPGMGYGESRKALWAMMENARGAGASLLNDDVSDDADKPGVYFDFLRTKLVLFPLHNLFVANVVMLAIGPFATLILLAFTFVASRRSDNERVAEENVARGTWTKTKKALRVVLGWCRFWIALAIGAGTSAALVAGFVHVNPYVVHSRPHLVLLTFLSLSYLSLVAPLQLLQRLLPAPPSSQKLAVFVEHYLLTWSALLAATILVRTHELAGLYWVSAWHACAWAAASVALVEGVVRAWQGREEGGKADLGLTVEDDYDESDGAGRRYVRGVRFEAAEENGRDAQGEVVETEPTEITPLMHQHRAAGRRGEGESAYAEYGWWIVQLLVAVPLPALLLFQLELLLVQALMNTLVDGSSAVTVYGGVAALSLLIFLPLAPFAHKLHHLLTLAILAVFAVSLTVSWAAFPFTQDHPFKVFFQQRLELDVPSSASLALNSEFSGVAGNVQLQPNTLVRAVTTLTGLRGFVDDRIVPSLPSSWGADVECTEDTVLKPGLLVCQWEGDLLPAPGGNETDEEHARWLDVRTTRLNASSAVLNLRGTNTRGCRVYFDRPITYYKVHGASDATGAFLPGYEMPVEGVRELRLWTRAWGRPFEVEFGWDGSEDEGPFGGKAACEWAEYASASAGGSSPVAHTGLIPALEEVKAFLPLWALPTKATDGLVEAWTTFRV
ncbi:Zn-dependent exopeptidase [Wolfiporia cocos MD-104 SS10]|uniref:Peptide hydrolase n=1 Tax=Wolfiporia cocos (strain MD-104) TaxID=742152 RepID=A0A2H3JAA0_WOLCO|nr:Zn-dependent exopeptidase [Wolfiporia cocos MD-104 SS10]